DVRRHHIALPDALVEVSMRAPEMGIETSALLPERVFFAERPHVTLLRPCLALTRYLEPDLRWPAQWAAELFQRFLADSGPEPLRWWRTSREGRWRDASHPLELCDHLRADLLGGRARHLFR